MKFGKTIQSQQVPGWTEYYLNYKALKKIINSYAAGRPASDASLLSLGHRPAKRALSSQSDAETPEPSFSLDGAADGDMNGLDTSLQAPTNTLSAPALSPPDTELRSQGSADLDPLPPETEPPAPSRGTIMDRAGSGSSGQKDSFKAHRDVFFFTLQRELEKINAFYLIKERDLRLRLLTLLTNRKRLLSSRPPATPDTLPSDSIHRSGIEWSSLEEGWRLFERDLGKLQGFIEINATGFRKILKKWDKRSKSNTKELYLERQVEVQPCFNREFIAKLSDVVAANLLDIENGSEKLPTAIFADLPEVGVDGFDRRIEVEDGPGAENHGQVGQVLALDALVDLEGSLVKAVASGNDAIADWIKAAKGRQAKDKSKRLMRILWRAALQVPDEMVDVVLANLTLDFRYIDNINGRSPLHQAAIAGSLRIVQLCVERIPQLLEQPDTYDRRPIHYAAMHGHPDIVSFLLDKVAASPTDMDGYTPLMHAITKGHLEVVRIFVYAKVSLEPTAISNDLIPLSLACQFGHLEVAELLLSCGAKVVSNSEGLFPQHFAAKAGHSQICQLLVDQGGPTGGGKDRQDKYNLWTPLHHAAVGGEERHLACIKVLVESGCDVNAADEYGKSAGWYAAWFGHVECLNFLLSAGAKLEGRQTTLDGMEGLGLSADPQMENLSPGSDLELDQVNDDFELIPSLSLPPPIIPLRVYGHEFLAQRCLVQLSLGHPFQRISASSFKPKPLPVKLYSRSGQESLHLWSSLKLVMTSKSDITAVPHSVILPLADEREVFSFQVSDLTKFTLEFSLYPTFGSKVIGRAVILPSTFMDIRYHKGFVAPLLDTQLKTIGEVAFEVSCIRPFEKAQLEIGGRVETYWKSKVTPSTQSQDHAHSFQHRPLSISTSSPAIRPSVTSTAATKEPALVTASSLSGEYVDVVVQVTKDRVPVVYPEYTLPVPGLDIGVSNVTYDQFESLARSTNRQFSAPTSAQNAVEWYKTISTSLVSLESLLAAVPADIGLNVQLRYVRSGDSKRYKVGKSEEVNEFVDPILHRIYEAGRTNPGRKIIFSSFDPTVCTALNWKQPNFAVFFASYCGISRSRGGTPALVRAPEEEETDLRCLSVREAVNFAKSTNLLGVILEATTLSAVPSLVASVKDAGLLLAAFGESSHIGRLRAGASDGRTVDAFVVEGIMTLTI